MKKTLPLLTALLAAAALPASANDVLSEITSAFNDHTVYTYNDYGQVTRADYDDQIGIYYYVYIYNEIGLLATTECYQLLDGEEDFTKVFYLEFQYDAMGRMTQRENYNIDRWSGAGGYLKGGTIKYDYNAEGDLVKETTYMASFGSDEETEFQYVDYEYNDLRLLERTRRFTHDFFDPSIITETNQVAYEYDTDGRLTKRTDLAADSYGEDPTAMKESFYTTYTYDENGLCETEVCIASSGTPQEKHVYTFLNESASDVYYPYDPENVDDNFVFNNINNRIDEDTMYVVNLNDDELALYDVYTYHYAKHIGTGVSNVAAGNGMGINFAGDEVIINGVTAGDTLRVYDMSGKTVMQVRADGGRISMAGLAAGNYIAVSKSGVIKFCK